MEVATSQLLPDANFLIQYTALMFGLRVFSEAFGWIASKTENKFDNRVAKWITLGLNQAGKTAGLFGFGKPRMIK